MELIHCPRTLEEIRHSSIIQKEDVFHSKTINSPVGLITLVATKDALISLTWNQNRPTWIDESCIREERFSHSILDAAKNQLEEYFCGQRISFDIPLDPRGTDFQKQVWQELLNIPYGQSITYGEQARLVGRPKAARAVGAANGKNPIGILIPCHRVIGASGHLTGFAGGLKAKETLLSLERRRIESLNK